MYRRLSIGPLILFAAAFALAVQSSAPAVTIFESSTLGPTDVTWEELNNQVVPAVNISRVVFNGVRFYVNQSVITSHVGGHFAGPPVGDDTLFGAIVRLDNENDFPNSDDLSSPDLLGATVFAFPKLSNEVFGNLSIALDPGWHALIFGSGLFGAAGAGAALLNNSDIGNPAYISFQPGGLGWRNSPAVFDNKRFVVKGQIVPEPAMTAIALIAILALFSSRFRRRSWF